MKLIPILGLSLMLKSCQNSFSEKRTNMPFLVTADKVEQNGFVAKANSPYEIISNYVREEEKLLSSRITFKFAINGLDNEMVSGRDHMITCVPENGRYDVPLVKFGEQLVHTRETDDWISSGTSLHIQLDMRHVLDEFESKGYYEDFQGEKLYQEDFKGVFIAGSTAPLTWNFKELPDKHDLKLEDKDGDGIYEITLTLIAESDQNQEKEIWTLSSDISGYPSFSSEQTLVDALYNLSLEEVLLNTEADDTFRTGEKWEGVWTRDVSYSILLGLGIIEPEVAKNSLRRKVKSCRIVQDTGTGGAYPVSSDRVVWALAAYEIYQITGDQKWLEEIYPVIKQSLQDDKNNVFDPGTGLVKGESSFLDWREQTYPHWMEPADIFESLTLGTSAVHYQANKILASIAAQLGEVVLAKEHEELAETIKIGINRHLWMDDKGYYGQYLYGRNHKVLSPKSEALGEALCVLYDIAEESRQQQIVSNTPVSTYGIASIFPQIPGIPPYHNDGIWPFVQAYWSLASAKAGNEAALSESLDAIYRAAALFLTNKENFVAHSGDYAGTQINSDRQLWSVAGNIGMVYKVFFGLGFENDYLTFTPFVPQKYAGRKILNGLKIRGAILDLEIEGFGNQIETIVLDGQPLDKPQIPLTLEGQHQVKITLSNHSESANKINKQEVRFTPSTPRVALHQGVLSWNQQEQVEGYKVLKNGEVHARTDQTRMELEQEDYAVYQVIALNEVGDESFASEPISVIAADRLRRVELEKFAGPVLTEYEGFQGKGYVEISNTENKTLSFSLTVPQEGQYALDFVYSNGNGPVNTDNRCAIRALYREDDFIGTVVFPQRGVGLWSEWGISNAVQLPLEMGKHHFTLSFEPFSENMNGSVNQALLDYVRVIRMD